MRFYRLSWQEFLQIQFLFLLPTILAGVLGGNVLGVHSVQAQVRTHQKINDTDGGFGGTLNDSDDFGWSVARLGDLDGDGVEDLAVGAEGDDDGGEGRGAVWILFMNADGTVASEQKISDTSGGLSPDLNDDARFGYSLAKIGDLNGDGVPDLAVGTDQEPATTINDLWILFLNQDGTVSNSHVIEKDLFHLGTSVAGIGDLGDDGTLEIAVGADEADEGGDERGAVLILSLNSDGTVAHQQKISGTAGSFGGNIEDYDRFGSAVAKIGDLGDDGSTEIAVGAYGDDDGGTARGAVWVLTLNPDGTVASHQKISDTTGGFEGTLDDKDYFGLTAGTVNDLDGDGTPDLAVGTPFDDDGGDNCGAIWTLTLKNDGTVQSQSKLSESNDAFNCDDYDTFGRSIVRIGDLDQDGEPDLAVGAPWTDGGGNIRGALWVLFGEQDLLPVELTSFEATQISKDRAQIAWSTASEQNNAGFRVMLRSSRKGRWEEIGFVESKAEGGTSSNGKAYRYETNPLPIGKHWFRLEQLDLDGTSQFYGPVRIRVQPESQVHLGAPSPNPVQHRTTISFAVNEKKTATLSLYNVLGQKVTTLYHGTPPPGELQTVQFNSDLLSSGIYVIRLRAQGNTATQRLSILK